MTPERTAYLRQVATNSMAHGKTWTGPLGEVLMQAADAIRELAAEADELAALRIEHAAWGVIIDVTRKDRDALRARVAELEQLQVSIHKAADAARKAERADVVAWLHTSAPWDAFSRAKGGSEITCAADAIEAGEHEGAAGGS